MCSVRDSFRVSLSKSMVDGFGTSVESVNGRTDSKLVGFGVLSCWLQVSCKCARLECVRVPFVKSKQRYQIKERWCVEPPNLNFVKVHSQPAHRVVVAVSVRFDTLTLIEQHPLRPNCRG